MINNLDESVISGYLELEQCYKNIEYPIHSFYAKEFTVEFDGKQLMIGFTKPNQFFRALMLAQNNGFTKPFKISQKCHFEEFGLMLDCSRNAVLKPAVLKRFIRLAALMGYNQIQLYMEDTFEVNDEEYFGYMRGKYSISELKALDRYAILFGVELIPSIQTLAHLSGIMRWGKYGDIIDCSDILLVGEVKTYELIEKIFSSLSECFSSKKINIGMDEAHMLGRGRYQDKNGSCNKTEIFLEHIKKVSELANKYSLRPMMWSDMFFRLAFSGEYNILGRDIPECVKNQVPHNLRLVYWNYYSTNKNDYAEMMDKHLAFDNEIAFAGGAWTWMGFAPFNEYSIAAITSAFDSCFSKGIDKVFLACWGDNGAECPIFSILPTLVTAAQKAYDDADVHGFFKTLTNMNFDDFMLLDLPNNLSDKAVYEVVNPCRYLLYNDCFVGLMDSTLVGNETKRYGAIAKRLKAVNPTQEWKFLYNTLISLCEVLELKCNLGVEVRENYSAGNKTGLTSLLKNRFIPLIAKAEEFFCLFKAQWGRLNKSFGFEVHEIRICGLIGRIRGCAECLEDYINGKTDKIDELEQSQIKIYNNKPVQFQDWRNTVSTNVI